MRSLRMMAMMMLLMMITSRPESTQNNIQA